MAVTINSSPTTFTLSLSNAVILSPPPMMSPIDSFYGARTVCLSLAAGSPFSSDDRMRPTALISAFAGVEMYFRRFIARVLAVCPLCAEIAGTQQVALGSFSVLDRGERAFAISEHQGFTSEGEIAKRTNKILGLDVSKNSSLKEAISEFESLCHIRHAVVHCGGELMYLNRRQLGINGAGRLVMSMGVVEFQGVVAKLSNVVRTYNSHVGQELMKRWFREGVMTGRWGTDRGKFMKMLGVLWSIEDMGSLTDGRAIYEQVKIDAR